jgi:hypothetical protein
MGDTSVTLIHGMLPPLGDFEAKAPKKLTAGWTAWLVHEFRPLFAAGSSGSPVVCLASPDLIYLALAAAERFLAGVVVGLLDCFLPPLPSGPFGRIVEVPFGIEHIPFGPSALHQTDDSGPCAGLTCPATASCPP